MFKDASKYRNSVFSAARPEDRYVFDRAAAAHGGDAFPGIDANASIFAFKSASHGNVGIGQLAHRGKPAPFSDVAVGVNPTALALSPFFAAEPGLLAAGGDNGAVALVSLDVDGSKPSVAAASTVTLSGHAKRVEFVGFHPVASGIVTSAAGAELFLWDAEKAEPRSKMADLKDVTWSFSYSADGRILAASSKDGLLRLLDAQNGGAPTSSAPASTGPKAWRATWLTGLSGPYVLTTAFSPSRSREMRLWDARALAKPVSSKPVDSDPAVLIPVYDHDTNIVATASRGSPVLKWYEAKTSGMVDGATTYGGRDPLGGLCAVPKPALDVMACEVVRLLAPSASGDAVVPISARVPRRSYLDFQAELFPDSFGGRPALAAGGFWAGEAAEVALVSLDPKKPSDVFGLPAPEAKSAAAPAAPAPAAPVAGESKPAEASAPVDSAPVAASSSPADTAPESTAAAAPSEEPTKETPAPAPKGTPPRSTYSAPLAPVKTSAFRFLVSTGHALFDNLKSLSIVIPNESDAVAATLSIICFPLGGPGGRIGVVPTASAGKPNAATRLPAQIPALLNHGDVYDFAADPFDPLRLAAGCDDGKVRVWNVDPAMQADRDAASADSVLAGHASRVNVVRFHPRARDVLLTASTDRTLRLWDLAAGKELLKADMPDGALAAAFSPDGTKIAVLGRDKRLRVLDARTGAEKAGWPSHEGIKGARAVWLSDSRLASVGFGKAARREINVYDLGKPESEPRATQVDINPGILSPFWDEDLGLLFLAGRGDRNVSVWSVGEEGEATLLTRYESGGVTQGLAFFPKTAVDVTKVEVAKCWRLTSQNIELVSFTLPRSRTDVFQDNLYPPTRDVSKPAVESASTWFGGEDGETARVSLKPADMAALSERAEDPAPKAAASGHSQREMIGQDSEKAFVNTLLKAARAHEDLEEGSWEDKKEGVDPDEWD
ncbi:hypothetical protein DFJ74DRAFT_765474 [Hyaloraphidium curvatum]|nr:hypothetical protein DFJ74DRAFT_765474 [Hyaloraphidium curvatum]